MSHYVLTLVTQPMLQYQPNRMELRSMDSYSQILCRFQKCKQKGSALLQLSNEKSPFAYTVIPVYSIIRDLRVR